MFEPLQAWKCPLGRKDMLDLEVACLVDSDSADERPVEKLRISFLPSSAWNSSYMNRRIRIN